MIRKLIISLMILTLSLKIYTEEQQKASVVNQLKTLLQDSNVGKNYSLPPETEPHFKIIESSEGNSTLVYRCRYTQVGSIINAMESVITPLGSVEQSEEQNFIIIRDNHEKMSEIEEVLTSLDVQIPQILVEAKIVEVIINNKNELEGGATIEKYDEGHRRVDNDGNAYGGISSAGYNLGSPAQNPLAGQGVVGNFFPYFSGKLDKYTTLNTFIRWLGTARDARILSDPNLVVNLGTTASIITGEDIPIQSVQVSSGTVTTSIDFKRIGVKLNVTPVLINDKTVKIRVNPEVSSIVRTESFIQNNVVVNNPIIAIRNISTELTLRNGEVIMLGGLYSSEKIETERKIPYLGDIPILGYLFKSKYSSDARTQLVFFLKVHILGVDNTESNIHDIEQSAERIERMSDIISSSKKIFNGKDRKIKIDTHNKENEKDNIVNENKAEDK